MKKPVALLVGAAIVFGSILFGLQNAHADTVPPTCSRFADVPAGNEYAPYICWLAATGITTGTSATTFSPTANVTRQQMAAFLYRMAGQPAFTPPVKPTFSDVPANSDYFMNIEWLKITGITTGTSATTFSPTAGVTRQQMAPFFYRMAGQPAFTQPSKPTFSDVPANSQYFLWIEWLKTTGITTGTSPTTFSPTAIVTRQQMAAFLYRMSTTNLGCTQYPARVGCMLMTGSTPTISGTVTVGSTLTAIPGTWSPAATLTYQWSRDGVAITGATSNKYVLVAADAGHKMTVTVTGSAAGYTTISKTSAATAAVAAAPTNVVPDPAFRACLNRYLGQTSSASITATQLRGITGQVACPYYASVTVITSVEGAQYLTGMTQLDLEGNHVSDVSQLAGLTNLTVLYFDHNQISDVSPLAGLKNLTSLGLSGNKISGVSALAGLTNLWSLDLSGNQISNVSALTGFTNLNELYLSGNQISNVSPLAGLTNLTYLDLGTNQISNVSPLAGLTNLTYLYLGSNQISDVSPLAGLTKLIYLVLVGNPVCNTSPSVCS